MRYKGWKSPEIAVSNIGFGLIKRTIKIRIYSGWQKRQIQIWIRHVFGNTNICQPLLMIATPFVEQHWLNCEITDFCGKMSSRWSFEFCVPLLVVAFSRHRNDSNSCSKNCSKSLKQSHPPIPSQLVAQKGPKI